MLFYGIAAGAEALAAAGGWNEALYRTWYLTGAVWTAGWLGLGTAFLLGRTRFGYAFALCLFLAGLFTFLVRNRPEYADTGAVPLLYFIAAGVLALAVAVETYFQNERWPRSRPGDQGDRRVDRAHGWSARRGTLDQQPAPQSPRSSGDRLLAVISITGALRSSSGALLVVFMPKRVLPYRKPEQPAGSVRLSRAGGDRSQLRRVPGPRPGQGRLHSRVPRRSCRGRRIHPSITDGLSKSSPICSSSASSSASFLFARFLVSIECSRVIPFTSIRLGTARRAPGVIRVDVAEVSAEFALRFLTRGRGSGAAARTMRRCPPIDRRWPARSSS
jgi:hypothetical protein